MSHTKTWGDIYDHLGRLYQSMGKMAEGRGYEAHSDLLKLKEDILRGQEAKSVKWLLLPIDDLLHHGCAVDCPIAFCYCASLCTDCGFVIPDECICLINDKHVDKRSA